MSGNKSAYPLVIVAMLSVATMVFIRDDVASMLPFPVTSLIPYTTISLVFVIILTLSMRQALTMYVASIIAIISVVHFHVYPELKLSNDQSSIGADTHDLLISFVTLLPIFSLIKIPAHKVIKSIIYLIGSLIAWVGVSFVIARLELPVSNVAANVFSAIAMKSPFLDFWYTPLQFLLLCVSGLFLLIFVFKSIHNIHLLAIAVIAAYTIIDVSTVSVVLFAILGSLLCLSAAILSSRNMAFNDELTGIPGRRSLNQYAAELSSQFSVVMIDIDFFKKFNDKYGHEAGDDVIKLVASKINKTGNKGRAFRYGGEEFTLVFDGKNIDDIRETIEDLRVQIESYPMAIRVHKRVDKSAVNSKHRRQNSTKQDIVRVTCSFGISDSVAGSDDFKAALKRADSALYKAKKGGRNCVRTVQA